MDQLSKKQLVTLAILLILVISLPVIIYLVRQQQIFKSRAAEGPSIEIVDSGGNPITTTNTRNVRLRLQLNLPVSTSSSLPSASVNTSSDNDGDGDPNSTDCGRDDPRAHHGQTEFFATAYTNSSGQSSFDFNCDGQTSKEYPLYATLQGYWFFNSSSTSCTTTPFASGVVFKADYSCGTATFVAGNGTSACQQANYGTVGVYGTCLGSGYFDTGGCTVSTPVPAVACR